MRETRAFDIVTTCPSLVTRTRNVRARCVDGEGCCVPRAPTLSLVTRTRNVQQPSLTGGVTASVSRAATSPLKGGCRISRAATPPLKGLCWTLRAATPIAGRSAGGVPATSTVLRGAAGPGRPERPRNGPARPRPARSARARANSWPRGCDWACVGSRPATWTGNSYLPQSRAGNSSCGQLQGRGQ